MLRLYLNSFSSGASALVESLASFKSSSRSVSPTLPGVPLLYPLAAKRSLTLPSHLCVLLQASQLLRSRWTLRILRKTFTHPHWAGCSTFQVRNELLSPPLAAPLLPFESRADPAERCSTFTDWCTEFSSSNLRVSFSSFSAFCFLQKPSSLRVRLPFAT